MRMYGPTGERVFLLLRIFPFSDFISIFCETECLSLRLLKEFKDCFQTRNLLMLDVTFANLAAA